MFGCRTPTVPKPSPLGSALITLKDRLPYSPTFALTVARRLTCLITLTAQPTLIHTYSLQRQPPLSPTFALLVGANHFEYLPPYRLPMVALPSRFECPPPYPTLPYSRYLITLNTHPHHRSPPSQPQSL